MRIGIAVVLSAMSLHVHAANAPCDANVPIKGCRADIGLDGKFIVLTSNTPKCSVIEWTLDGSLRQTTVLDGEERLELLTTTPKKLTVESCTQVKDLRSLKDDVTDSTGDSGPFTAIAPCECWDPDGLPGASRIIEKTVTVNDRSQMRAAAEKVCTTTCKDLYERSMASFCSKHPDAAPCK